MRSGPRASLLSREVLCAPADPPAFSKPMQSNREPKAKTARAASPEDAARERWEAREQRRARLAEASRRAWDKRGRATAETRTEPCRLYCVDVAALFTIAPEPRDAVRRLLQARAACLCAGCGVAQDEAAKDDGPGARPVRPRRGWKKRARELAKRRKAQWTAEAQTALRDLARRRRLTLAIAGDVPTLSGRFKTLAERVETACAARRICSWTVLHFGDAETDAAEGAAAGCTGGRV